jgi:hypothetical protein
MLCVEILSENDGCYEIFEWLVFIKFERKWNKKKMLRNVSFISEETSFKNDIHNEVELRNQ